MQEEEKKGSSNSGSMSNYQSATTNSPTEDEDEADRQPQNLKTPQDITGSLTTTMKSLSILSRRKVENPTRKFADYKILKIIGTGTFGKVYLANL